MNEKYRHSVQCEDDTSIALLRRSETLQRCTGNIVFIGTIAEIDNFAESAGYEWHHDTKYPCCGYYERLADQEIDKDEYLVPIIWYGVVFPPFSCLDRQ